MGVATNVFALGAGYARACTATVACGIDARAYCVHVCGCAEHVKLDGAVLAALLVVLAKGATLRPAPIPPAPTASEARARACGAALSSVVDELVPARDVQLLS